MSNVRSIHALELGGTLFIPASHKNLDAVLSGKKYPELRSVVIDFEDGLANKDRQQALDHLDNILENLQETKLLRFIRPKNSQMLKAFLQRRNIEKIDGFILPKFGLANADKYLSIIQNPKSKIRNPKIMPSIEGEDLFDVHKLQQLREIMLPYKEQIICTRFGAQDMLRQLGLRQDDSIYDMLAPRQIIANLITTFNPYGFDISAPVYPNFCDLSGFEKEISFELQNGLISKTIIHPNQIRPINELYRVSSKEFSKASSLLQQESGVVNLAGSMGEFSTQKPWGAMILKRKKLYGQS